MNKEEQERVEAALNAFADQIQEFCNQSGLDILGFSVLVASRETDVSVVTRARTGQYMGLLEAYVEDEKRDPSPRSPA
jgi:hypothetical protein